MKNSIKHLNALVLSTQGKFFTCEFYKKDGSLRKMLGQVGVRKYLKGTGASYNSLDYGLVRVWDVRKCGYRQINLTTLQSLRCGSLRWKRRRK